MATFFISDLHLDPDRKDISQRFFDFLSGEARTADALYILGDLFEVWLGDDDDDPYCLTVQTALREFTGSGVPGYFMHGNRDFMIGTRFATSTGLEILPDPTTIQLYDTPVLISHGDQYCTDDAEYQSFRRESRDPAWQQQMLALPLEERRHIAQQMRADSQSATTGKSLEIMDVNQLAIEAALSGANVCRLLHGHTHRPAIHRFAVSGAPSMRIVLGDWYEQASILCWDDNGFVLRGADY